MFTALLLSSVASGLLATLVMVVFLYLPLLWGGGYYDVLGAIGSALTKQVDERSRLLGGLIYFAVGIVIAMFYGWLTLLLLQNEFVRMPQLNLSGLPVDINFAYPLIGLLIGLGHGIVVALFVTVLVEHHPIPHFRTRYILIISQVISHLAYGATVLFFHSQFLQLLGQTGT